MDVDLGQAQQEARQAGLELIKDECGLVLTDGTMKLSCDFMALLPRLRQDRLARELVVRAARIKAVTQAVVVDATAGLGEDSLLFAAAGCKVLLFENDAVIAALLHDGLQRAAGIAQLAPVVARMQLFENNSVDVLPRLANKVDVVYLDPMFPGRSKSAAVKKKFQLLHQLEQPCTDERALLHAALAANPRKVVIKRPLKAPTLAASHPSYSLLGKAVRFDVIVPPQTLSQ
ncbi:class I SAM-dependent methyltransferase [uncultured Olegusella sp.]|uniref:class I SAM-dependent methyltransferase n=1 Tax=uncultured Olegusella sp. TaxID=1979846 RepID=UPI002637036D|nr:class I SAM-dependent methyltransferase [uncultured Olegusella sp.]